MDKTIVEMKILADHRLDWIMAVVAECADLPDMSAREMDLGGEVVIVARISGETYVLRKAGIKAAEALKPAESPITPF